MSDPGLAHAILVIQQADRPKDVEQVKLSE